MNTHRSVSRSVQYVPISSFDAKSRRTSAAFHADPSVSIGRSAPPFAWRGLHSPPSRSGGRGKGPNSTSLLPRLRPLSHWPNATQWASEARPPRAPSTSIAPLVRSRRPGARLGAPWRFSCHSPDRAANMIRRRQSIARRTATARPVVDTDRTARTAGIRPFPSERSGGLHERSFQYRSGSWPGSTGSVPYLPAPSGVARRGGHLAWRRPRHAGSSAGHAGSGAGADHRATRTPDRQSPCSAGHSRSGKPARVRPARCPSPRTP